MSGPWKTKKGWSTPLHSLDGPIYAPPPPRRVATLPIRSVRVPRRRTDSLHVVYTSTPQLLLPTPPLPAGRRSSPRGKPHSRDSLSLSLAPILTGLGAHGVFGVMPQRRDSSIPSSPAVSRCRVRLLGI